MRIPTLIACFMCITFQSMAVNPPNHFPNNPETSLYADDGSIFSQLTLEEMVTLKKKEIKSKIGRKLKFREWIALKVIKTEHKKATRKIAKVQNKGKGQLFTFPSSILLIISLTSLFLPVLAVIAGILGIYQLVVGLLVGNKTSRSFDKFGQKKKADNLYPSHEPPLAGMIMGL